MAKNKGFTLVEVIVVVVILAVLATMLIPKMTGFLTKGNDEQNWEDAGNIIDSAQTAFYELYANNDRQYQYKSIINYISNVGSVKYTVNNTDGSSIQKTIFTVDIKDKVTNVITLDIFRDAGFKVGKIDTSGTYKGRWRSDKPCWVAVITGDCATYCDPTKATYCPEKAYTVYAVIYNKNAYGDFFIMDKNRNPRYPRNIDEFINIVDSICDENDPPGTELVKQIYLLKGGIGDDNTSAWSYFTTTSDYTNKSYNVNRRSKYDDYH